MLERPAAQAALEAARQAGSAEAGAQQLALAVAAALGAEPAATGAPQALRLAEERSAGRVAGATVAARLAAAMVLPTLSEINLTNRHWVCACVPMCDLGNVAFTIDEVHTKHRVVMSAHPAALALKSSPAVASAWKSRRRQELCC